MQVKRIVVTGDCLRPDATGHYGGINTQTRWLEAVIGRQLGQATGLPISTLLLDSDIGIPAPAFYRDHGFDNPLDGWPRVYCGEFAETVISLYKPHLRDALVVGFELPPYLHRVLTELGIPFVDLWVHPIRFLDDLLFACRASDPTADAAVAQHALPEEIVWLTAGLRRATAATAPAALIDPGATLVLGQALMDKSQIGGGRFADGGEFDPAVRELAAGHEPWLVKPHPYAPDHPFLARVRALVPRCRVVTDNVYYLLAQDAVARVLTLNSSSGIEAQYFGKEAVFLMPPVLELAYRGDRPRPGVMWTLADSFLNMDFWREVLAAWVPVTPKDGYSHPPKPNRLRTALRSFWNFNQFDTDVAVHVARPIDFPSARVGPIGPTAAPTNILPSLSAVPGAALREGNRFHVRRSTPPRVAVHGPYLRLDPGEYQVEVRYEAQFGADRTGPPLRIDVTHSFGEVLVVPMVAADALDASGIGRHVVKFRLTTTADHVEVRIWAYGADVVVRRMDLSREDTPPVAVP